jgi:hypothetical protein
MARQVLEWDQVVGNEGYKVEWGTVSGAWDSYPNSATVGVDLTSTVISGLSAAATYYWRVAALVGGTPQDASAESSFSAVEYIYNLMPRGCM